MALLRHLVLTALVLLLGLSACGPGTASGLPDLTKLSRAEEREIGGDLHRMILRAHGGKYHTAGIGAYVDRIGHRIADSLGQGEQEYTFTVLNDPIPNAYTGPGGYIYITRGMLALLEDEAQLAAVLGHEIGHVTARHPAHSIKRRDSILASFGRDALDLSELEERGDANSEQIAAASSFASYSRHQELEADLLGVGYLSAAGYDPHAMPEVLETIDAEETLLSRMREKPRGSANPVFAAYPDTRERVGPATQAANVSAASGSVSVPRGRDAYLDAISDMIYGGTAKSGYVRGQRLLHPTLNFTLTVPENYVIHNLPEAAVFERKGETEVIGIMVLLPRGNGDLLEGLMHLGKPYVGARKITVNGMPGVTVADTSGDRIVRLFALEGDDEVYLFLFSSPDLGTTRIGSEHRKIVQSFRRLTADERKALHPWRIRIHRVSAGETVASLAALTPLEKDKVARFRVLNGLKPGEQVQPGQKVKLVQ